MGCETIWGPGNTPIGHVRIHGRGTKSTGPCSKCGEPGDLLCDGPHPSGMRSGGKTCDKPLCRSCAVSIRYVNVDFCPEHGHVAPHGTPCMCSTAAGVPCAGVLVEKMGGLCLTHAVLFDYWLGHAGGLEVYHSSVPQEEKRQRFRGWLAQMPAAGLDMILVHRHLR